MEISVFLKYHLFDKIIKNYKIFLKIYKNTLKLQKERPFLGTFFCVFH